VCLLFIGGEGARFIELGHILSFIEPLNVQALSFSLAATKPGEPPSGSFWRTIGEGGAPAAPELGRPVHGPPAHHWAHFSLALAQGLLSRFPSLLRWFEPVWVDVGRPSLLWASP